MALGPESALNRRLRRFIWTPEDGRVRAGWRILGALALVLGVLFPLGLFLRTLDLPVELQLLLTHGTTAVVAFVVSWVWAQYLDRRQFREYGFHLSRRWWRMLGVGVLVGASGWGGALATDIALGWASVASVVSPGTSTTPFLAVISVSLLTWALVGFWEELIFRGLVLRNAIEGFGFFGVSPRAAVVGGWVFSSVLFGLLHLNQVRSVAVLGFWILAGVILGFAHLFTGELALPVGLHFGFNIGLTNIFGLVRVRGSSYDAPTLIEPAFGGPTELVGVSGAVNTVWLLVMAAVTVVVVRWHYGSLRPRIEP